MSFGHRCGVAATVNSRRLRRQFIGHTTLMNALGGRSRDRMWRENGIVSDSGTAEALASFREFD